MKATVTSPEAYLKVLAIEISEAEINTKYELKLKKVSKEAKLPGFRAGKVPASVIVSRFGQSIRGEAIEELINESFRNACVENKINPVGEPVIEEVQAEDNAPVTFKAIVQVDPEITVAPYKKLGVKIKTEAVEPKEVDDAIAHIREQFAELVEVDRKADKGDLVTLAYRGVTIDGEVREGFNPAPQMVEIGKAPLPELDKELKGVTKGTTKEIKLTFPKDFPMAEAAGKKGLFTIDVESVKERIIPSLDADFLAKLAIESEEKMREVILEDLTKQKEQALKSAAYDEAIKKIIEKSDIVIPPARVDHYITHIMKEELRYYPQGGQPSVEEYKERYTEVAINSLKRFRILDFIANAEKIKATTEEVDAKILEIAQQYNQPFETVKQAFRQNGTTMQIREDVKEQKALDCLVGALTWPNEADEK